MAKELNRNAFSEKLIHRYLMETYYFSDRHVRNSLLPEKFHQMEINLIVPESSDDDTAYRADLSLYFKNSDARIPVEVKWTARELTKQNQIEHLKKHDGFVVSFENTPDGHLDGIPNIEINYENFKNWIAANISKLTRESISERTTGKLTALNQYWIVFLRGESAGDNFQRMLKHSPNALFWAFRQDKRALENILDIQRGDTCVFIFGKGLKQGQGYSSDPEKELVVENVYVAKVVRPYYMELTSDKSTFFEANKALPINRRIWPHFIDFKIKKDGFIAGPIRFGKQDKLGSALADSTNHGGGTPVQISLSEFESLRDRLNLLKISTHPKRIESLR